MYQFDCSLTSKANAYLGHTKCLTTLVCMFCMQYCKMALGFSCGFTLSINIEITA